MMSQILGLINTPLEKVHFRCIHATVYKVTNLIDGKIYIGKHKCSCSNCVYYGSGIHISKAIKKYGKKNFAKEILAI